MGEVGGRQASGSSQVLEEACAETAGSQGKMGTRQGTSNCKDSCPLLKGHCGWRHLGLTTGEGYPGGQSPRTEGPVSLGSMEGGLGESRKGCGHTGEGAADMQPSGRSKWQRHPGGEGDAPSSESL